MFDLQKNQTLENIIVMSEAVYSVAFLHDNESAFTVISKDLLNLSSGKQALILRTILTSLKNLKK